MKNIVSKFIILVISLFVVASCNKPGEKPPAVVNRSVLIYMAANNSLDQFAKNNLQSLKDSYSESDLRNCNLIVYYHGSGTKAYPQLLKVSSKDELEVIKQYDDHNSADNKIMASVIRDFKELFPANSYGCVLWSHGTAWLPKSFTGRATKSSPFMTLQAEPSNDDLINHPFHQYIRQIETTETKAFGQNGQNWMEIEDLEDGLADSEFEFIIFDACFMSSIEVAYSLRKKAKWMLASPTEVLGDGLQYGTFAKHIFVESNDYPNILKNVAQDFTNKYSGETTYAIYDLSKMDKFATDYKALMATIPNKIGKATSRNVQHYDRYNSNHVLFDLVHYVSTISDGAQTDKIQSMVDRLIVHKYAASSVLGIPITNYSGVSTYIPFESYNAVTPFYKELRWWNNVLK